MKALVIALRSLRAPFAVVVLGAWLRLLFDDVATFSQADETQYLQLTQRLVDRGYFAGYAELARDFLATQARWAFPTPLRCGHFAITTLACRIAGECSFGVLAAVSTLAGIVAVGFAWALARELTDERAALAGGALVALSPLQLGMSRRALGDEVACAAALAAAWTIVKLLRAEPARARRWAIAACATATLAIAVKETFLFYAPGLFAIAWSARRERGFRRADLAPLLAPLLFYAWYSLLARGAGAIVPMARVALAGVDQPYAHEYQGGAPHRYLVDLVALCPASTLVAIGAIAVLAWEKEAPDLRGARSLAWLFALSLAAFSIGSKLLRFAVGLDALACLLAGWLAARLASRAARPATWLFTAVAIAGAIDLSIFQRVFVERDVYDPTTDAVLRALGMLPR